VAEKVAQVKGVSVQEIEEMTSINAKRLFKLS
jgi:Tat protein secretion system quality control protein TatD with DNase activity